MTKRIGARSWTPIVTMFVLVVGLRTACAEEPQRTVLCVDHAGQKAALSGVDSQGGCENALKAETKHPLETGDEVRVDTGRRLGVRVINTNTAFFDYDVTEERIEAKDKASWQSFLKALGPYLLEMGAPRGPGPLAKEPPSPSGELARALKDLDGLLDRLRRVDAWRTQALPEIARNPRRGGEALVSKLEGEIDLDHAAGPDDCKPRWPVVRLTTLASGANGLSGTYLRIAELLKGFEGQTGYYSALVDPARKALAEQATAMEAAYTLQALVRQAANASDQWCWSGPEIRASRGHKVSISLTPMKNLESQSFAPQEPYKLAVEVQPRWLFRPAVGLSLLYSKKSVFPTYDAKELDDKKFTPTQSGEQDARLSYGLTLGFSWRSVERHLKGGWAFWLPELSVNADSDNRGIGVGAGVSWKVLKFGAGWLWTKHKVLAGDLVADETIMASAADLQTKSTYSPGKFYVSISVIGWQPFVSN